MINVNVNVKKQLIRVLVKQVTCGILVHVIVNVIKLVKLVSNLIDIKNCACKDCVIVKLILTCDDEILDRTKNTSSVDKKVTYEKIIALFALLCKKLYACF